MWKILQKVSVDSFASGVFTKLHAADRNVFTAADIISTVEFDHTGNYLATGDKGGRVVLFERNESVSIAVAKQRVKKVSRLIASRRKHASTNSTQSFNHTNPNLIT